MNEFELRNYIINNVDESYFIKAGAGAGKTHTVVFRIINQFASGIKPEEIVAISFTKKASEELLSRIIFEVNESFKKEENPVRKANLDYALNNIGSMQVSTIHSFAKRIIDEQIFSAKLPMNVKLLEDEELENELRNYFTHHYLDEKEKIVLAEEINNRNIRNDVFDVFKTLVFLNDDINVTYDREIIKDKEFDNKVKDKFDSYFKKIEDYIGLSFKDEKNLKLIYAPYKNAYLENDCKALAKAIKDKNGLVLQTRGSSLPKEEVASINESLIPVGEEYLKLASKIDVRKVNSIINVAEALAKNYKSNNKRSFLSNDDLLNIASKIVFEKEAFEFYKDKFKCFYIDEFQDTDHVQTKMILKLCARSYDDDSLVPGKLVVVGDYKQSIYRFRGADLHEYFKVEDIFKKQNNDKIRIIDLSLNFRSSNYVIEWVNKAFKSNIFDYSDMVCPSKAEKEKAYKEFDNKERIIEGVYYINSYDKLKASEIRDLDLRNIIRLIKNTVNRYYIYDGKIKNYRLLKYSDFMILTKTTTGMSQYLDALINEGLPVSIAGKIYASFNIEIRRLVRLYAYISLKETDDIALEGAKQVLLDDLSVNYQENFEELKQLKESLKDKDAFSLLLYLSNNLQYVLNEKTRKERMNLVLSRIKQMVESIIENTSNDYLEVNKALNKYLDKEIKRSLSLKMDNNAITLMNVHQSKGLEANIVIIAQRSLSKKQVSPLQYQEKDKYQYHATVNGIASYADNEALLELALKEDEEELKRLEYVAATRAKEALIILPGLEKSFMSLYKDGTEEFNNGTLLPLNETDCNKEISSKIYKPNKGLKVCDSQKEAVLKDITPSSLEVHDSVEKEFKNKKRPKGKNFGTVLHKCLELYIKEVLKGTPLNISKVINIAILLENGKDSYREYLEEVLNRVSKQTYFINGLKQAKEVKTEMPFFIKENDEYIHGFIDLLLIGDDNIKIIDYKSDAMYSDEDENSYLMRLNRQYENQLKMYKKACAKIFAMNEDKIETEIMSLEI